MNDPVSSISAPPPRYLLESDSSDEEGQGQYPSSSRPRRTATTSTVAIHALAPVESRSFIVGIGQAGRYLHRRAATGRKLLDITVDGKPIGAGREAGEAILVVLDEPAESAGVAHELAKRLLDLGQGKQWTVVTSYLPSMYIPDPSTPLPADPPIRVLSTTPSTLPLFDAPNYIGGLAASLVALSSLPSALAKVDALMLPLPLSAIPATALPNALASAGSDIKLFAQTSWSEDDDEPFVALGMGGRRLQPAVAPRVELSSMYM